MLWVNKFFWPSVKRIRNMNEQQDTLQEKEKKHTLKLPSKSYPALQLCKCKAFRSKMFLSSSKHTLVLEWRMHPDKSYGGIKVKGKAIMLSCL